MKPLTNDHRLARHSSAAVALDQLEVLIRWCRDPIVAETMVGNDGFANAVRTAEISLESCRRRGWDSGIEFHD